jgi:ferredoxin
VLVKITVVRLIQKEEKMTIVHVAGQKNRQIMLFALSTCIWCQNPETLKFENELVFTAEKCIACGDCAKACTSKATTFDRVPRIDRGLCRSCFACVEVCPSTAREKAGGEYSADELGREV